MPLQELAGKVRRAVAHAGAELSWSSTGAASPDIPTHQRATDAAVLAAGAAGLPVLAWALPREVTETLNQESGTAFVGRDANSLDGRVDVARSRQWTVISRHQSQAGELPLVARRLELLGSREYLRWLLRPSAGPANSGHQRDPVRPPLRRVWRRPGPAASHSADTKAAVEMQYGQAIELHTPYDEAVPG